MTIAIGLACEPAVADETEDLLDLSLQELMQIEITSVSKKSQKLSNAAAAIYVITAEDIKRSGATSIPEALRLAPGLDVARIDSNKWAISSRGFNGRFANKLQVLIDGRSAYTPTFAGVYWEVQDTLMEDIDRIEVIRGPGAALWGSNAVNGVINVITKTAKNTQGGSFSLGTGTYEKRFGSLRYGMQLDDKTFARTYVKGFHRGQFDTVDRHSSNDSWDSYRGGFRVDRESGEGENLTLQGDLYQGDINQGLLLPTLTPPGMRYDRRRADVSGMNLLGRWKKALDLTSELSVQAYYDHTYRNEPFLTEERDTLDLDAQHRFLAFENHDVVWGFSYRWSRDDFSSRYPVFFSVHHPVRHLVSGLLQDEITLLPNQLKFTLGARLEHNGYTGFEGQPNARLLWTPSERHSFWGAISRAVRIPSRAEDAATLHGFVSAAGTAQNPSPFNTEVLGVGGRNFKAETVWSYEIGYRFMPKSTFSLDLALFYNHYDRLRANDIRPVASDIALLNTPYGGLLQITTPFGNGLEGNSYGTEVAVDWRPTRWWQLQLNYTYLKLDLQAKAGGLDRAAIATEGADPRQQVSLRSGFSLTDSVELDFWLRYVDTLRSSGFPDPDASIRIPSYATLDTRLAWRPLKDLELSLVGQNLLDSRHPEAAQELYAPRVTEIPRSVYARLNWHF